MQWIGIRPLVRVCAGGALVLAAGAPHVFAQTPPPPSPLTLQQAVTYAVEDYPAIRASAARVSAHEAGVDLAETSYLPRLDSVLQINRATRNNVSGLLLPGAAIPSISGPVSDSSPAAIWGSVGGLLLSWELFDFGARSATIDVARYQVARAAATAELTRVDVAVRTADAYLRLATAQETVRAARANVERMEVFANAVSVLVKNQLRAGADDSRAQAELAVARIQLVQAEQVEEIARAGFAQWVGVEPDAVQIATGALMAAGAWIIPFGVLTVVASALALDRFALAWFSICMRHQQQQVNGSPVPPEGGGTAGRRSPLHRAVKIVSLATFHENYAIFVLPALALGQLLFPNLLPDFRVVLVVIGGAVCFPFMVWEIQLMASERRIETHYRKLFFSHEPPRLPDDHFLLK